MNKEKKKHLFRYSRLWHLLGAYIFFVYRLYYKVIVVTGREKIPRGVPLIFAPNHQNALMDPLAIHVATGLQTVFLARADIFRKPLLGKIFSWLKILPVYRIRDGKDNLQQNEQSFDAAIEVLEHGQPVGLFPEAAHSNKRALLPMKKGVPRIAFLAEERNDFKLGLRIVPAGIYYSRYYNMGGVLHIRFGDPIQVGDFETEFRDNPQRAHLLLRDVITSGIRPLAIDISKEGWYEIYESILSLLTRKLARGMGRGKHLRTREFEAGKRIIAALDHQLETAPEVLEEVRKRVGDYEQMKKKYRLSDKTLFWRWPVIPGLIAGAGLLLAGLPLFLYGFVNHIPAYFIPQEIVKKFKDKQFYSSVKFLWGALVVPLLYLLQAAVVWMVAGNFLWALAYLVSLPLSGLYARWFAEQADFMIRRWRLFFLKQTVPTEMRKLRDLLQGIMAEAESIVLDYRP